MLVLVTALFWCGGFHFKFSAINNFTPLNLKSRFELKIIAVFVALKMPLSIRVQRLLL